MTQRGSSQSFLFKYAPLRLKGVNNQPSNNSKANLSGNQFSYSPRSSRPNANTSINESITTETETSNSESCDLNSSLDNIARLCQRQERRNFEMQMDVAAGEIEQLQNINEKLSVLFVFFDVSSFHIYNFFVN